MAIIFHAKLYGNKVDAALDIQFWSSEMLSV